MASIKCSRELPACFNCVKSKRLCTGYQRKHTFILSQDMISSDEARQETSRNDFLISSDDPESGKIMLSRWRLDPNHSRSGSSSNNKVLWSQRPGIDLAPFPTEPHLRHTFKDQFFSFLTSNAKHFTGHAGLGFGDRNGWIIELANLPQLTPALEDALLAVCKAKIGRETGQLVLVHESLRLYASGMSQLRNRIVDPSEDKDILNLAACLVFLLYEVTVCPGGNLNGYMAHWRGAMNLLQMRRPTSYSTGLAHSMLRILRFPSVCGSLSSRPGRALHVMTKLTLY